MFSPDSTTSLRWGITGITDIDHLDDCHNEGHHDEVDYYDFSEIHDAHDLTKDDTTTFNIYNYFQKDHKKDLN